MPSAIQAIDSAIQEVGRTRTSIGRVRSRLVRRTDDLATLKSVSYAWFNDHRSAVLGGLGTADLSQIDAAYQTILDSTERSAAKATYVGALGQARRSLIALRSVALIAPERAVGNADDVPPDFSPLVGSEQMRVILTRRWDECRKCVSAEANLAAIVMMGGLLESLFVARANQLANKDPLLKANSAPKDRTTGRTINYQDWMLDSYIKVGHELKWISDSAKQFADVLKEFRNYVHPAKELRHGVNLAGNDSAMFWTVTKALARQLLASVGKA